MSATRVAGLLAWEALDSRGTPTVACELRLAGGARGGAVVPSGASTGRHEAHERRDGGERFGGRGVLGAVEAARTTLADAVLGTDVTDLAGIDALLREADGTPELGRLGANAVLAVSVAAACAAANAAGEPLYRLMQGDDRPPLLPLPMVNVISGGAHAPGGVDVQDFLVVPLGASSLAEAIEWAWRVRAAARRLVEEAGLEAALVADEGGLGPALASNEAAVELLTRAIEAAGFEPGGDVGIALDVAAGQLELSEGRYGWAAEGREVSAAELVDELEAWAGRYPIVSLEDPLADEDWAGWALLSRRLRERVQLIGDDLFVTHPQLLHRGVMEGVANAVLVKPNQVGTLSDARDVVDIARRAGYAAVVSARSGETEDSWLADLAVGWRAGQIKVGSLHRSERTAKWNRLLRIEAELGGDCRFAGGGALAR